MDSLTQAVLGAGIQGALLGKYQKRKSLWYGAALATLPDLDVLIAYQNPVSSMTYHRGFSHSLLVLTLFSVLLTYFIKHYRPQSEYSTSRLWLTLWLVLVTHPLLDAFTVYGTQLFWPFQPTPQQWSGVFIVDPLYTIPLLLAVIWAFIGNYRRKTRQILSISLCWSCIYLAWGTYGQYHHQQRVQSILNKQNIQVTRIMATPMPFNTLLYRVVAQTQDGHYIEAVSGWFDRHPAEWIRLEQGLALQKILANSQSAKRLFWFSDGWLRYEIINHQLIVTDLRMGVAGHHFFRFIMAKQNKDGQWQIIEPERYDKKLHDSQKILQQITQRIFNDQAPLPLQEWANHTEQP